METSVDIRSLAGQGLQHTLPSRAAVDTMQAIEDAARAQGDRATLDVVALTRAAQKAVPSSHNVAHSAMLVAFRAIEKGAVASVGFQATLASHIVDEMDKKHAITSTDDPGLKVRNKAIRGMLAAIAENAAAEGAHDAPYAAYIAKMGDLFSYPRMALNWLTGCTGCTGASDWVRPARYANVAAGEALIEHEYENNLEGAERILDIGNDAVRALAREQGKTDVEQHLARLQRYCGLVSSPTTRLYLKLNAMRLIGDDLPCDSATAVRLAHKTAVQPSVPPADKSILLETAVRQAMDELTDSGPDTPFRAWVRFYQKVACIDAPEKWRKGLQEAAMYALDDGRPPDVSAVQVEVLSYLSSLETDDEGRRRAAALLDALDDLHGPTTPSEPEWRRDAANGLHMANVCRPVLKWEEPILETYFARIRAHAAGDAEARTVVALTKSELSRGGSKIEVLRRGFDRLLRIGQDAQQDALIKAHLNTPPPPGTITVNDGYVTINGIKIPKHVWTRDAVQPNCRLSGGGRDGLRRGALFYGPLGALLARTRFQH